MHRATIAALALAGFVLLSPDNALARPRGGAVIVCGKTGCHWQQVRRYRRGHGYRRQARRSYRHHRHHHSHRQVRHHRSYRGYPAPLLAKVRQIRRRCGSRIGRGYVRGARVAGTGRVSNHALHRAFDVSGNPRCIYRLLRGWPGGYSTDYWSAPGGPHVHISYNRRKEWGARFRHRHRRHARRWRR